MQKLNNVDRTRKKKNVKDRLQFEDDRLGVVGVAYQAWWLVCSCSSRESLIVAFEASFLTLVGLEVGKTIF